MKIKTKWKRGIHNKLKLLAKPDDFYNVEIDIFGSGTNDPTYTINVSDETDDGIPPLCDRINELIERGFRFTNFNLDGDMIGWKYFEMKMKIPQDKLEPYDREKRYNWK